MLDSRVLCDQQLDKRRKQRFVPLFDIVNELKKPGTAGISLVNCHDTGAANSARALRSLASYSPALHTSHPQLHLGRTLPVHG